jgi:hypothetical protein
MLQLVVFGYDLLGLYVDGFDEVIADVCVDLESEV